MTTKQKKGFDANPNPLAVLVRIIANGLFDDKYGTNATAYHAILILAELVDKPFAAELRKKITRYRNRYRYEN